MNLAELTLEKASVLLRSGMISPVELTKAYLERIGEFDGALNAYITVTADTALERARTLEKELSSGRWRGPLHGIPVALKDNIDTAGIPTTGASELFRYPHPAGGRGSRSPAGRCGLDHARQAQPA